MSLQGASNCTLQQPAWPRFVRQSDAPQAHQPRVLLRSIHDLDAPIQEVCRADHLLGLSREFSNRTSSPQNHGLDRSFSDDSFVANILEDPAPAEDNLPSSNDSNLYRTAKHVGGGQEHRPGSVQVETHAAACPHVGTLKGSIPKWQWIDTLETLVPVTNGARRLGMLINDSRNQLVHQVRVCYVLG